ncbi:cation:proton antiporter domain-containing protein [Woodsholea maritima]|uniref:cation:proton antiporter domain-containing protein n=1 Tax=Woodsholea maritima TaxID=240237 RepID=UPI0003682F87|nr:cation:proton antiporter [Woodsholea maritima]
MHDTMWMKDAIVFLIAAGLVVPLFRLVRMSAVLGFLIAGLVFGPYGLGRLAEHFELLNWITITDPHAAEPFAELGVLFLLFILGLELSFQRLWRMRQAVFGAGGLQALLSAAVIAAFCLIVGFEPRVALIAGLALALSSTAIVMQVLSEERRTATPVGQSALAVLLMQDILVAPILILVGLLTTQGEGGLMSLLTTSVVQGVLAVAVIVLIGRFALRPLYRLAVQSGGRDLTMALTLVTLIGAALITAGAGLSLALGAFLAGVLVGETEFRHQTAVDLEPFKGLLLGLFFMTVGMSLDLMSILSNWPYVLGGLVILLTLKSVIGYLAVRLFGSKKASALEVAALLAPAGEFAFVVIGTARVTGLMEGPQADMFSAIAGLSMMIIPAMGKAGQWLADKVPQAQGAQDAMYLPADLDKSDHVIIIGFGRVGRAVAEILRTEDADILALDANPDLVAQHREAGWNVYYGDASQADILHHADLDRASMVILTLDNPFKAYRIVRAVREVREEVPIFARAHDCDHANELTKLGVSYVIPETVEAGLQIAGRALEEFGLAPEVVRDRLACERENVYKHAVTRELSSAAE